MYLRPWRHFVLQLPDVYIHAQRFVLQYLSSNPQIPSGAFIIADVWDIEMHGTVVHRRLTPSGKGVYNPVRRGEVKAHLQNKS